MSAGRVMMAALLLLAACAAPTALPGPSSSAPPAIATLPVRQVNFLGEVHDNPDHHRNQALAIRRIRPRALVFEMIDLGQEDAIAGVDRRDAAALARALRWEARGWPEFRLYHPVFLAAPEAEILGAGAPPALVRRAAREGAAAAFGPEAARYGLDRPLPAPLAQGLTAELSRAHCGLLPADRLPAMVEVQRLRDALLARRAFEALRRTGGPVVVITGNGHARRDRGAPWYLARRAPGVTRLALGQFEGAAPPRPPFDLWLVTPARPRPDPCEALRARFARPAPAAD